MTLEAVQVEVRSILLNAAWRAYGGRVPVETEGCESCGGDGCRGGCPTCGERPAR